MSKGKLDDAKLSEIAGGGGNMSVQPGEGEGGSGGSKGSLTPNPDVPGGTEDLDAEGAGSGGTQGVVQG